MNYLKNIDISKKYQVSRPTVTRWVSLAINKKNDLQVKDFDDRHRIIDNDHNHAILLKLSTQSKKYRAGTLAKKVSYDKIMDKYFSEDEKWEIYHDLWENNEVNLKFTYKYTGAESWNKMYTSHSSPISDKVETMSAKMIDLAEYYTETPTTNLVDLGAGNGYPVKQYLLNKKNEPKKYIPIDISQEMLEIAKKNVLKWNPEISVQSYVGDIESMNFVKPFNKEKFDLKQESNLILFVGNTICNFSNRLSCLNSIAKAMTKKDLLIITLTMDTPSSRSALSYQRHSSQISLQTWILNSLGIDTDKCESDIEFSGQNLLKYRYFILDKDYKIEIEIYGKKRELFLAKKTKITTWKHYVVTTETVYQEFEQAGLDIISFNLSNDKSLGCVMARVKSDR